MTARIENALRKNWSLLMIALFIVISLLATYRTAAQSPAPTPNPIVVQDVVQAAENAGNRIEDFFARLTQPPQSNVMRVVLVVIGVVLLVAGWRIYELVILIAGAIVGAAIANSLIISSDTLVNLLALIIGAVIGAALGMFFYYVAVFLVGAHLGILFTNGLATLLSLQPVALLVLLIGAVIGGLVLLGLSFEFLILLSALVGGQLLSLGLGLNTLWALLFALVGIIVQFGLTRAYHYEFRRPRTTYRSPAI